MEILQACVLGLITELIVTEVKRIIWREFLLSFHLFSQMDTGYNTQMSGDVVHSNVPAKRQGQLKRGEGGSASEETGRPFFNSNQMPLRPTSVDRNDWQNTKIEIQTK